MAEIIDFEFFKKFGVILFKHHRPYKFNLDKMNLKACLNGETSLEKVGDSRLETLAGPELQPADDLNTENIISSEAHNVIKPKPSKKSELKIINKPNSGIKVTQPLKSTAPRRKRIKEFTANSVDHSFF